MAEKRKIKKAEEDHRWISEEARRQKRIQKQEQRRRLKAEVFMMADEKKKVEHQQLVEIARLKQEHAERMLKVDERIEGVHLMYEKLFGKRFRDDLDDEEQPKNVPEAHNPFAAPIISYDASLLLVNHPFIDLGQYDIRKMPPDNVVDGQVMDKDAISEAIRVLMRPVVKVLSQFRGTKSELGARILHAFVLQNIRLLTPPSLDLEVRTASKFGGSDSCEIDDEIRHKGDDGDVPNDFDQFLKRTDRYDIKGMVVDKKSNTKIAVLIVECDLLGEEKKLFQASGYGIRAAIRNAKKGFFRPIYLHNWGHTVWRHGVLRPRALVEVKDGQVIEVSTETGRVSKKKKRGKDKAKETTQTEASGSGSDILKQFDEKLEEKTQVLCEEYVLMKNYPDGFYIAGSIDLNTTDMIFPALDGGFFDENMIRFVNGLMRTFVGDSVLEYTKDDVQKIVAARSSDLEEDIDRRHAPFSRAYDNFTRRGPRF